MEDIGITDIKEEPTLVTESPDVTTKCVESPSYCDQQSLYARYKTLLNEKEILEIKEDYLKDEIKNLRITREQAKEEVKRICKGQRVIGQFVELIDNDYGVIQTNNNTSYYVPILSTINRELLKPGCSVMMHHRTSAIVGILPNNADSTVKLVTEKPDVTYADIGGMDIQKQEIREAIELPLSNPQIFTQIGIDPPRGVLMYGPPGTGKTMLAKAVANATTANFIQAVGSEFVQKYLGEGARMVRNIFSKAKESAPCIVFIDEIDAIATKRYDANTGADREVQRILMELLTQMDGFDQSVNVKVIMATNRPDTLDPALLRPGRLDRKVEFPLPDRRQRRLIFQACTNKMSLSDEVDLEDFVNRPQKVSAAQISSICQEAGLQAIRKNRYVILTKDFEIAFKRVVKRVETEFEFYS
ncbi:hypothetical protein WA158_002634 [Blastocystis sp. Blastoise]